MNYELEKYLKDETVPSSAKVAILFLWKMIVAVFWALVIIGALLNKEYFVYAFFFSMAVLAILFITLMQILSFLGTHKHDGLSPVSTTGVKNFLQIAKESIISNSVWVILLGIAALAMIYLGPSLSDIKTGKTALSISMPLENTGSE